MNDVLMEMARGRQLDGIKLYNQVIQNKNNEIELLKEKIKALERENEFLKKREVNYLDDKHISKMSQICYYDCQDKLKNYTKNPINLYTLQRFSVDDLKKNNSNLIVKILLEIIKNKTVKYKARKKLKLMVCDIFSRILKLVNLRHNSPVSYLASLTIQPLSNSDTIETLNNHRGGGLSSDKIFKFLEEESKKEEKRLNKEMKKKVLNLSLGYLIITKN